MTNSSDQRMKGIRPERRKVLAEIRRGPTTMRQVAQATGLNLNGLSQAMNSFLARGLIEFVSTSDADQNAVDRLIRFVEDPPIRIPVIPEPDPSRLPLPPRQPWPEGRREGVFYG